jgi:hypothetical protein
MRDIISQCSAYDGSTASTIRIIMIKTERIFFVLCFLIHHTGSLQPKSDQNCPWAKAFHIIEPQSANDQAMKFTRKPDPFRPHHTIYPKTRSSVQIVNPGAIAVT